MDATKKRAEKLQAKGKPVDFKELLRLEPDGGTTNIRNVKSKHWTKWLGPENRCVVPLNSFSEFNKAEGGDIWFALDETRPLACFDGIWTAWTSVRKAKEGETTNDIFAFLTTEPNAEVGSIHPKAMPVILTTPDEVETWMTAPEATKSSQHGDYSPRAYRPTKLPGRFSMKLRTPSVASSVLLNRVCKICNSATAAFGPSNTDLRTLESVAAPASGACAAMRSPHPTARPPSP